MKYRKLLTAAAMALSFALPSMGLELNEVRIDHFGSDTDEYIEIKGNPGESLNGVWFIYVGDHSGAGSFAGSGSIEIALDLSLYSIPADGIFLMVGPNLHVDLFGLEANDVDGFVEGLGAGPGLLENTDNVTLMLVRDFTGNGGNQILGIDDQLGDAVVDIDSDDDGIPNDVLPWSEVIDAVGYINGPPSTEFVYGAAFGFSDVGPMPDGDVPGHVWRGGNDGVWHQGNRELFEEDANNIPIGIHPSAVDTPGSQNPDSSFPPSITSVSSIFVFPGETLVVSGENLDNVTSVFLGETEAQFVIGVDSLEVTIPDSASSGHLFATNADGMAESVNLIVVLDSSDTFLLLEDFSLGLGDASTYSVASNANWEAGSFGDSYSIGINGYQADTASDDWLILPALDLEGLTGSFLIMGHERAYGGPPLEVKVSTDYSGTGDPNAANWTDIPVNLAEDFAFEIVDSGKTDLSAWDGQTIYVAVRYTSDGPESGQGATDRIHYVVVGGQAPQWENTLEFGWIYHLTPEWDYSFDLGFFNQANFPWIYQANFGWMNHISRIPGEAIWLYSPTLEWIYSKQGSGGRFFHSSGGWTSNHFIFPETSGE